VVRVDDLPLGPDGRHVFPDLDRHTMNAPVTRFAPSPTGYLHLGHAYSALFAEAAGGRFLLRIEDIDAGRCRPEFEDAIYQDLAWLGLEWETPVRRQSDHMADYAAALTRLGDMGLIYPCFCTRADIRAEIEAAGGAPHGPDGPVYPGTCRALPQGERRARIERGDPHALRLDAAGAAQQAGELVWRDDGTGEVAADAGLHGDVVLARKDTPTSYHLSVTVDDHLQGVSLVTRGEDLFAATHVHRLLQALLDFDTPSYRHHRLLTNAAGSRLAKRDRAVTIRALREAGKSPQQVRQMAG
jgi:glutamyl-Q tRNA(Asp) synthetase